jgi:hypothetical protein
MSARVRCITKGVATALGAVLLAATAAAQPAEPGDPGDPAAAWNERLRDARKSTDAAALGEELLNTLEASPELVAQLEYAAVAGLITGLERSQAFELETRVLEWLIAADWRPSGSIARRPEHFDVTLALRRAEAGDHEGAEATLSDVRASYSFVSVMIDRRFQRLWPQLEARGWLDARTAVEREVAEAEALRAANPRRLEAVKLHLSALRRAGRPAEAVAAGAAAQDAIVNGRRDVYDDAPHQANWVLDEIARSLDAIGEAEEARRLRVVAAVQEEDAEADNVSQLLNSAAELVMNGEPAEAVHRTEALGPDQTSLFGWGVLLQIRACGYAQLGEAEALEAALDAIDALGDDAFGTAMVAHLCADRPDRAAATLIARLKSRQTRADTLIGIQRLARYRPTNAAQSPATPPPSEIRSRINTGYADVRDRPDVRLAIFAAGRILDWDVAALE